MNFFFLEDFLEEVLWSFPLLSDYRLQQFYFSQHYRRKWALLCFYLNFSDMLTNGMSSRDIFFREGFISLSLTFYIYKFVTIYDI